MVSTDMFLAGDALPFIGGLLRVGLSVVRRVGAGLFAAELPRLVGIGWCTGRVFIVEGKINLSGAEF